MGLNWLVQGQVKQQQNAESAEDIARRVNETGRGTMGEIGGGDYPPSRGKGASGGKVQYPTSSSQAENGPAGMSGMPPIPGIPQETTPVYVPILDVKRGFGSEDNFYDSLNKAAEGKKDLGEVVGGYLKSFLPNVQEAVTQGFKGTQANKIVGVGEYTEQQRKDIAAKYGVNPDIDPLLGAAGEFFNPFSVGTDRWKKLMANFGAASELQNAQGKSVVGGAAQSAFNLLQTGSAAVERTLGAANLATGGALGVAGDVVVSAYTLPKTITDAVMQATGVAPFIKSNVAKVLEDYSAMLAKDRPKLSEGGFVDQHILGTGNDIATILTDGIKLALIGDKNAPASMQGGLYDTSRLTRILAFTRATQAKLTQEIGAQAGWSEEQIQQSIVRANGQIDQVMTLIEPDEKRRLSMVQTAEQVQENMGIKSMDDLRNKIAAGTFTYESPEKLVEAAQRLNAGEGWETIEPDLVARTSTFELVNDFVGQIAADPSNAVFDGVTGIMHGWGKASAARWIVAGQNVGTVAVNTPNSVKLLKKIPGVGKYLAMPFERTASTTLRIAQEETGSFAMQMLKRVNTPEVALNLRKIGITEHPSLVALDAFVGKGIKEVPDAVKLANEGGTMADVAGAFPRVAGSTKKMITLTDGSTVAYDDLVKALGYAPEAPTPKMVEQLGLKPGQMLDPWNSEVANNARVYLSGLPPGRISKVADAWKNADEVSKAFMKTGEFVDGKKVLKGLDAYQKGVVEPVEKMLLEFDGAIKEALGINPKPTTLEKIRDVYQVPQQFMAALQTSPLNPGFGVRNFAANQFGMATWHMNILTPWSTTRSELSRLGLLSPTMTREGVGLGAEGLKGGQKQGIIRQLFEKSPLTKWNTFNEIKDNQAVFLQGFKKSMNSVWKMGKGIPEVSVPGQVGFDTVQAAVKDKGVLNQLKYMFERARTVDDLKAIPKAVDGGLTVRDVPLMQAWDEAGHGVPLDAIFAEAAKSDNPEETMIELLSLYADDGMELTNAAGDLMQDASKVDFSIEQKIANNIEASNLPEEVKAGWRQQFQQRLKVLRTQAARNEAAANELLEQLSKTADNLTDLNQVKAIKDDVIRRQGEINGILGGKGGAYETASAKNDALLLAVREAMDTENIAGLISKYPEFAQAGGDIWPKYFEMSNAIYMQDYWIPISQQVEDVVRDLPGADRMFGLPYSERIAGAIPPTTTVRMQLWDQLIKGWRDYGFKSEKHFVNWLSEDSRFISAESRGLSPYHIQSQDWYNAVVDGMQQHKAEELAKGIRQRAQNLQSQTARLNQKKAAQEAEAAEFKTRAETMKEQLARMKAEKQAADDEINASKAAKAPTPEEEALAKQRYEEDYQRRLEEARNAPPAERARLQISLDEEARRAEAQAITDSENFDNLRAEAARIKAANEAEEIAMAEQRAKNVAAQMKQYDQLGGRAAQEAKQRWLVGEMLDAIRDGKLVKGTGLDDAGRKATQEFADSLIPRMEQSRSLSQDIANKFQDAIMFNYQDRRNFDLALPFMFNYPFWYTRNLASTVQNTLMHDPAALAAMVKLRAEIQRSNEGQPDWFKDNIDIALPSGGHLHLPILATIDRLNGFFGDKFYDKDMQNTGVGATLQEAQNYGVGVNANISILMALDAYLVRGKRDEALTWMSYLGAPTKGVRAATAMAKSAGVDFLPAGGVIPEFWMWNYDSQGRPQMVGSKYDFRRQGVALQQLVDSGEITPEQAADIMRNPEGPLYDKVLQQAEMNTAGSVIMSWLLGAGVRPRNETEMDVVKMDAARAALVAQKEQMSAEEYRTAWVDLRNTYPYMDFVVAFRRDADERDSLYTWSVFDRLPPNSSAYFTALGYDDQEVNTIGKLLDDFYTRKGDFGEYKDEFGVTHPPMNAADRAMLMGAIDQLGAILAMPGDATEAEWNKARSSYRAMMDGLNQQYSDQPGEIQSLQDAYWETPADQREAFLTAHPRLEDYWRSKDQMVGADPLLGKYYASMELYQRNLWADWREEMAVKYPDIQHAWDEYDGLKQQGDVQGARDFWKAHPELSAYLHDQNVFQLHLAENLDGMGAKIADLEGEWATLRADQPQTLSHAQQSVADMIKAGSRPMGDFTLPDDMDATTTRAQIQIELDSASQSGNYGELLKELKAMGGLDRTLTGFQSLGNTATVGANLNELRALMTAMASVREKLKYPFLDSDSDMQARSEGGAISGSRVTSRTYGSGKPAASKSGGGGRGGGGGGRGGGGGGNEIAAYVVDLQKSKPAYWAYLRSMADMTPAEIKAFLTSFPEFATWLEGEKGKISLGQIRNYFKKVG